MLTIMSPKQVLYVLLTKKSTILVSVERNYMKLFQFIKRVPLKLPSPSNSP